MQTSLQLSTHTSQLSTTAGQLRVCVCKLCCELLVLLLRLLLLLLLLLLLVLQLCLLLLLLLLLLLVLLRWVLQQVGGRVSATQDYMISLGSSSSISSSSSCCCADVLQLLLKLYHAGMLTLHFFYPHRVSLSQPLGHSFYLL
jgi:hypothetical protein